MDEKKLIAQIQEAFSDTQYPGDQSIISGTEKYHEAYEMFLAFRGKKWQDIDLRLAEYWQMNLPRLTALGFQYYLPAFLVASLDGEPTEIDLYVVFALKPPSEPEDKEWFLDRVNLFTPFQKSVISDYLSLFYRENPTYHSEQRQAILGFWQGKDG